MDCNDLRTHLVDFLYGECDPLVREEVATHLDDCPVCRKRVETFGGILKSYRQAPHASPPPDAVAVALEATRKERERAVEAPRKVLRPPVWKRLARHPGLAAAAVVLIVFVAALRFWRSPEEYGARKTDLESPLAQEESGRLSEDKTALETQTLSKEAEALLDRARRAREGISLPQEALDKKPSVPEADRLVAPSSVKMATAAPQPEKETPSKPKAAAPAERNFLDLAVAAKDERGATAPAPLPEKPAPQVEILKKEAVGATQAPAPSAEKNLAPPPEQKQAPSAQYRAIVQSDEKQTPQAGADLRESTWPYRRRSIAPLKGAEPEAPKAEAGGAVPGQLALPSAPVSAGSQPQAGEEETLSPGVPEKEPAIAPQPGIPLPTEGAVEERAFLATRPDTGKEAPAAEVTSFALTHAVPASGEVEGLEFEEGLPPRELLAHALAYYNEALYREAALTARRIPADAGEVKAAALEIEILSLRMVEDAEGMSAALFELQALNPDVAATLQARLAALPPQPASKASKETGPAAAQHAE
ncbi:MAG: zf-HC2 domain-containing protein [Planctomycetota bacterium]